MAMVSPFLLPSCRSKKELVQTEFHLDSTRILREISSKFEINFFDTTNLFEIKNGDTIHTKQINRRARAVATLRDTTQTARQTTNQRATRRRQTTDTPALATDHTPVYLVILVIGITLCLALLFRLLNL